MSNSSVFNAEYDGTGFTLEGSSTGLLLFHGFTATTLEVRGLAEEINTRLGWTVSAPLLPGHGTSPVDLSRTHFGDWLLAAESAYSQLKLKSKSVFLGGESMGGLLSLYLAAKHPEVMGLLIYAPALITPGMQSAKCLRHFIFGSNKKNLSATLPGFLPWQGYRINPLKAVVELGKLQDEVKNHLPEIHQPILIFQGKQDKTIDPRSSSNINNSVSSKNKELIELDNCGHCILLDVQHASVFQKSASFLTSIQTEIVDK
jgi:carboxylesterase